LDIDPERKVSFALGSRRLCQISSKSVKNCDRESADTHTDRQTDRDDTGDLIICPMLCWTDNNESFFIALSRSTGSTVPIILQTVKTVCSSVILQLNLEKIATEMISTVMSSIDSQV